MPPRPTSTGWRSGPARAISAESAEFDRRVHVRAGGDDYAQLLVADAVKRETLLNLCRAGFDRVTLTGTHAEAVWAGFDPRANGTPGLTHAVARALVSLGDDLPPGDVLTGADFRNPGRALVPALWVALAAAAASVAVPVMVPPVRLAELVGAAALSFAVLAAMLLAVAALTLAGTTTAHDRLKRLALCGLPLLALGSVGGVQCLNVYGDARPAVTRLLPVLDTEVRRGKSTSYRVYVADWQNPGERLGRQVTRAEFEATRVGRSRLVVETRPGLLGVEYQLGRRYEP